MYAFMTCYILHTAVIYWLSLFLWMKILSWSNCEQNWDITIQSQWTNQFFNFPAFIAISESSCFFNWLQTIFYATQKRIPFRRSNYLICDWCSIIFRFKFKSTSDFSSELSRYRVKHNIYLGFPLKFACLMRFAYIMSDSLMELFVHWVYLVCLF